ncbi:toprim domain-containing protein [Simplicispira psychrophila]|uniref:toprim domain-containing protein n=1 Tax=Simplicispira psychrophila TaxID=80882 RepID=UPI00056221CF|nr:toprim domain-containing protein [Simplicispira psychrophila]
MSAAIESAFSTAMAGAGLQPPDDVHADGVIHRYSATGKRGDQSAWYVLHLDGVPAGSFGCWKAGLTSTWCSRADSDLTEAERSAHRERIKAMQRQRDADEKQRHQCEADKARARWLAAAIRCQHPYLTRKGVQAYGIRQDGDTLLVPLRDTSGLLHSLQTIDTDGNKRFKGRMKGCYHPIGRPQGVLVVGEGYATCASIHAATGHAVACAFNAGNLLPVAAALRRKYPDLVLLLAADDDHRTEGNPGLTAATAAALAVGGYLVKPQFSAERPPKATDFNDLHHLDGLAAVRACFAEVLENIPC